MKTFLFFIANCLISSIFAQTELQKLEQHQNDLIIYSKKQAAFSGQIHNSGTTITYIEPSITSEDEKLIEEKIINYRKIANQVVIIAKDESETNVNNVRSERIPLSEFNSFPLNVQKYIISKRAFYESYIKFD